MMMFAACAAAYRSQLLHHKGVTMIACRWWHMNLPKNNAPSTKQKKPRRGRASYRFVDQIRLRAVGGSGGKGNLSLASAGGGYKRKPDGGHGGRGGHIFLVADPTQKTLKTSHPVVLADSGGHGSSREMFGRAGKNKIIRVPCGVVVKRVLDHDEVWDPLCHTVRKIGAANPAENLSEYQVSDENDGIDPFEDDDDNEEEDEEDYDSIPPGQLSIICEGSGRKAFDEADLIFDEIDEQTYEERERIVLADLDKPGSWCLVARGGRGGRGNCDFAKVHGPLPDPEFLLERAKAQAGEIAYLELELKLIADLGLVGFPNAGKSSLLSAMSRATPAIAPYPFTTLHPLVGVIEFRDGFKVSAADVPGLVKGASEGRGRGHDFLRHIERTKALMYVVDSAGTDGRDPIEDLRVLADELSSYADGDLLNRPAIVAANKVDLLSESQAKQLTFELGLVAKEMGIRFTGEVFAISAGVTGEGLPRMSRFIRTLVQQCNADRSMYQGSQ